MQINDTKDQSFCKICTKEQSVNGDFSAHSNLVYCLYTIGIRRVYQKYTGSIPI